jgi:hypothetical protein
MAGRCLLLTPGRGPNPESQIMCLCTASRSAKQSPKSNHRSPPSAVTGMDGVKPAPGFATFDLDKSQRGLWVFNLFHLPTGRVVFFVCTHATRAEALRQARKSVAKRLALGDGWRFTLEFSSVVENREAACIAADEYEVADVQEYTEVVNEIRTGTTRCPHVDPVVTGDPLSLDIPALDEDGIPIEADPSEDFGQFTEADLELSGDSNESPEFNRPIPYALAASIA